MALTLTERTVNYIIKNLILSSLAFSSPKEGQLRYDDDLKVPAWFDGDNERNLTDLTINELSDVKDYIDTEISDLETYVNGSFGKTLEFTSSEDTLDYEIFEHNFNNENVECTVLDLSNNSLKVYTSYESIDENNTKVLFGDPPNTNYKVILKALVI